MKNKNFLKILMVFLTLMVSNQSWSQITAQQAVKAMGRGINMGNTLEPPTEGGWNNGPAKEYYFDLYKKAGFKTVRIPIRWDKHTETISPFTIDAAWLDRVEEIINWGLSRDLYIIINAHHEDWFKIDYSNQKERMDSIWCQVSRRFQGKSEKLLFEMINEPRTQTNQGLTQAEMDEFNERVLSIIRTTNPTRVVVYGGKGWSSSNDLINAAIPDPDDQYLMAYYHSYDPWNFAGEGIGTWGSNSDINSMVSQMAKVETWSSQNNIPVIIGEFGAQKNCEYNSRMFYYANYTEQALAHGLAFAEWDDGGDFETMKRKDSTWNDIKDILIYTSDTSPTKLKTAMIDDTVVQLTWVSRSASQQKVLIEKRTLTTEFSVVAEFEGASSTTYLDYDAVVGDYSYYRVVDVYKEDTIPSYAIRMLRISIERAPYLGQALSIPGVIEAENFDLGGEMLAYHDTDKANKGGAYRLDEAVDIQLRDDGGYHVGYVADGEWMEYTVNVAKAGTYNFIAHAGSMQTGGKFQLSFPNKTSDIITAPNTGSWVISDVVTGSIELTAGEQIMRLTIKGTIAFNIDKIVFEEITSLNETKTDGMYLYPNPASERLEIAINDTQIQTISIFNNMGKLVLSKTFNTSKVELDLANLKPGIYFITAKTSSMLYKSKFVKQ